MSLWKNMTTGPRRIPLLGGTAALLALSVLALLFHFYNERVLSDVKGFLKEAYGAEDAFIRHIPIHEDFATPGKERILRSHLLADHLKAAKETGLASLADDAEIGKHVDAGRLVPLKGENEEALFYFYGVPKPYRYLTPEAKKGLWALAARYQANLARRGKLPPVKLAVSSVLRPESYQKDLRKKNPNASLITTHSQGASFDLFYDDYFVVLVPAKISRGLSGLILEELKKRMGFMLGDSLRRQLHSVLMETLLELQEEGKIYAILEKGQKCYHVTVLPEGTAR